MAFGQQGKGANNVDFRAKMGSLRSEYLGVNLLLLIRCLNKHNFGKREVEEAWGFES